MIKYTWILHAAVPHDLAKVRVAAIQRQGLIPGARRKALNPRFPRQQCTKHIKKNTWPTSYICKAEFGNATATCHSVFISLSATIFHKILAYIGFLVCTGQIMVDGGKLRHVPSQLTAATSAAAKEQVCRSSAWSPARHGWKAQIATCNIPPVMLRYAILGFL